ncbi:MAG: hypothetical protein N0C80_20980 [Candidatus Thiodiazotropha endolucinida]|nr:hypothetical protein [Candidatus Thiodiazotropha taylori]MCW4273380.1 hypothetical protein [Candidatus Thiodiazotropha endolucinida]
MAPEYICPKRKMYWGSFGPSQKSSLVICPSELNFGGAITLMAFSGAHLRPPTLYSFHSGNPGPDIPLVMILDIIIKIISN